MEWKIERLRKLYEERCISVEAAFSRIQPGNRLFVATGCAEPQFLVGSLGTCAKKVDDIEIVHLVTLSHSPMTDAKYAKRFRLNSYFIGNAARDAVRRGDADYTPIFLSEIPNLVTNGQLSFDVALVQVTPPDSFGNCSLGVSVETVKAVVENARFVIAQVNPRMPRTMGDSFVNVSQLHAIVEHEEPILEYISDEPDEVADRIGFYVSRLVPNGSTIQAGIGSIPNAVLRHLKDKKDLGVHTEMFSDGLIELYEAGVVNNRRKNFHEGKIVAAFCLGSQHLYDTIDSNPIFEFYPTNYVSDPRNISKNDNQVAINSALEIDLTGQVCADSIGAKFYSGFGGQADFVRGAALSKGGRPIIAIPSTAKHGEISRIAPCLKRGAGVVTTRGDVHYVVTEFGIAYLHGKNIRERAMALINIAHPKFRAWLLEEAKKMGYVYSDQVLPPEGVSLYPEKYHWEYSVQDKGDLSLRPIRPVDEEKLRRFFYSLSESDVYYRFMGSVATMPHEMAQPLVVLDYEEKFAIVGTMGEESHETIVSVARWFLDRASNMAEVAFTVQSEWQRKGIGTFMFQCLVEVALEKGISGFTAEVLSSNSKMIHLFQNSGYRVSSKLEEGVHQILLHFDKKS